ncbi:MAG: hypothetical protein ACKOCI_00255 [Cyanobium sp.]
MSLLLAGILAVKILVHRRHWEELAPNPLFPALVASEVFLMGFLLNGVLMDYKESEKIPGELASALECLASETDSVRERHADADVTGARALLAGFATDLLLWIRDGGVVTPLLNEFETLQRSIQRLAIWNPAPLQARLLLELAAIRRHIYRIEIIRETAFIPTVYWMTYVGAALLLGGLMFAEIEPFGEALYFIGALTLLLLKLLFLIGDLDNPFSAAQARSVENVTVYPLALAVGRLNSGVGQGLAGEPAEAIHQADSPSP